MTLKLYYDSLSQPCRAVELLLKVNNVSYTPVYVNLTFGEHKSEAFSKISQFKKLPVIEHNGKLLMESVGIMRYLTRECNTPDHWYPKDSYQQAKVDEYLEWHHLGVRLHCYSYVWLQALNKLLGKTSSPDRIQKARLNVGTACDTINDIWLKNKLYLTGNKISIADLLGATELDQLDFNVREGRPALADWLERVRFETNPHYDHLMEKVMDFKKEIAPHLSAKM